MVAPRSDHGTSAPQMLQAAASAAGAPLVASPYPQSYLQYNPQQYGQQQVLQAMTPYPGQVEPTEPSLVSSSLFLWIQMLTNKKVLDAYWATYESIFFLSSTTANVLHASGWSKDDKSRWWSSSTSSRTTWRPPVLCAGRRTSGATTGHLWWMKTHRRPETPWFYRSLMLTLSSYFCVLCSSTVVLPSLGRSSSATAF